MNYFGGKISLAANKIQQFFGNPNFNSSLNINSVYRELKIEPVKISKPDGTKLALYFLPHIPERLLSVLLKENKIMFTSPCDESYAMVLFLHQKRSKSSAPSVVVPSLEIHHLSLPQYFDIVVWSHESITAPNKEKTGTFQIISVPEISLSSIRIKEVAPRYVLVVDFFPHSDKKKKIKVELRKELMKMRPFILMRIDSSYVNINDPLGKDTFQRQGRIRKSEKMIEKEVFQRLAAHFKGAGNQEVVEDDEDTALQDDVAFDGAISNPTDLPRPILRVIIKNTDQKFLSLKSIESKLEGLVANPG